jgi:hypothetical protein
MQVVAISDGFYGGMRRREGSRFEWKEKTLAKWVVAADSELPKQAEPEKEPETLSELNKKQKPTKIDKVLAGE